MPAAGASVARIDEAWLKNSTPPLAHLREQIGVGAELVRREELDVELAGRRFADLVQRFLRADVDRMARVLAGRELVVEIRRLMRGSTGPGTVPRRRPLRLPSGTCAGRCPSGRADGLSWCAPPIRGIGMVIAPRAAHFVAPRGRIIPCDRQPALRRVCLGRFTSLRRAGEAKRPGPAATLNRGSACRR